MNLTFFEPRTVKVPSVVFAFAFTSFASSTGFPQSYGFHIPVLPSSISHAVETWSAPSKAYSFVSLLFKLLAAKYTFGGAEGNRTPVQHAFYPKELQQFLTGFIIQAHQKHTLVIVLFTFTQNPLPGLRLSMLLMSYMI